MLECDRIDVSESIDINKTDGLLECIICHYWFFFKLGSHHGDHIGYLGH